MTEVRAQTHTQASDRIELYLAGIFVRRSMRDEAGTDSCE